MNDLTVSGFIEVLKTFPQSWPICVGDRYAEDCYGIKGVYDTSDYDYENPHYGYAYVQIVPFDPYDVELAALIEGDSVEMYGDRNWYNSNEIYKRTFKNGEVSFRINDKGHLEVVNCKVHDGNDMDINDLEEYTCRLSSFHFIDTSDNLQEAIIQVKEKYCGDERVQEAIREIIELAKEE